MSNTRTECAVLSRSALSDKMCHTMNIYICSNLYTHMRILMSKKKWVVRKYDFIVDQSRVRMAPAKKVVQGENRRACNWHSATTSFLKNERRNQYG